MGNKADKNESVIEQADFKIDHPRLKDMKFKRAKDNEEYMETTFSVHNKNDFTQWNTDLNNDPASSSENILLPIKSEFKQNKLCGSGGHVKVVYENFPYLLSYEIKNRQEMKKSKFQETELWYLVHTLANIGNLYHKSGRKVGNISPNYVFMSEGGVIKVASLNSWPGEKTNYENALYEEQVAYLSPQQLKDLDIGKKLPDGNLELAESFSTGLTILDSTMLENSNKLYSKGRFDYQLLDGRKQNLKNQPYYSPSIKHVILNLLEIDPKKRMTLSELKYWLAPYQEKIFNLQNFVPSSYHPKISQTASNHQIRKRNQPNLKGTYDDVPQPVQSSYLPQKSQANPQFQPNYTTLPDEDKERVTKTKEIDGGPTCSSRPKKKVVDSKVQPNYAKEIPRSEIPTRSSVNPIMYQPVQSSYQSYPYQKTQQTVGSSLQTIEEKIRNSKIRFPST